MPFFEYSDYRKLLVDFYEWKKAGLKGRFSYRAFAKQAGFGSPNYINLVVQGKKNLSHDGISRLADAMKLNIREREFFENLVYFNQETVAEKKDFYFKKMGSFREFTAAHQIAQDQHEYLSHWYYVAIRELVALPHFTMNYEFIAKKLKPAITPHQAKEATGLLQRLKLIEKRGKRWIAANPHLKTDRELASNAAIQYHFQMMERARESLDHPAGTREINAITMSVSKNQFEEIKTRIAHFQDEVQKYLAESSDQPDRVCQLNYQWFHLSSLE